MVTDFDKSPFLKTDQYGRNSSFSDFSSANANFLTTEASPNPVGMHGATNSSSDHTEIQTPLSFSQTKIWWLDQLIPGRSSLNYTVQIRFSGYLDVPVLEASLNAIIQRHDVLRARFLSVNGQPLQSMLPTWHLTLALEDICHLADDRQLIAIQQLASVENQRPFDLTKGALFRAILIKLGKAEHVLLCTTHSIVFDERSITPFLRELAVLYEAFSQDQPSPLPELPLQYPEFVTWERQSFSSSAWKANLEDWQHYLDGNSPGLPLPTDHCRTNSQRFQIGTHCQNFPLHLSQSLKVFSQQQKLPLEVILLAAFQTLLHRYTSQDDIVIGCPTTQQLVAEFEPLIGACQHIRVLRVHLQGNLTFQQLLSQVHNTVSNEPVDHPFPISDQPEKLQPGPDPTGFSPVQVLFCMKHPSQLAVPAAGLLIEKVESMGRGTVFDLSLEIVERPDGFSAVFEYDAGLFEATTIQRMATHFQTLLEGIVANPQQRLSDLPLLTVAERHQLLVEWNQTQADYPSDHCIHQLFEAQVERTPDAIAVVYEDQQLTYQELNCRANQLAHYLQTLGVGPDELVGIYVERSVEMIVGLLGILKAGGAYVPLNSAYPEDRLTYLLVDAQVSVLVTKHDLISQLPAYTGRVLTLDRDWDAIARMAAENPSSSVQAHNLAYVIYTSGSTGQPKGVMVEHRSILNLAWGLQQAIYSGYPNSPLRVSLNGPLAFDTSVKQIVQLFWGHTLEIVPEAFRLDGSALLNFLQQRQIDVLDCTPSQLRLLLSAGLLDNDVVPACVLIGGEPIDESMWTTLLESEKIAFFNLYGPTECTVDATIYNLFVTGSKPAIGRPIINTQLYVLDRHLQPVPIGISGELFIGGEGVARGYLNRSDLTTEKFIPNPFSYQPGSRLYRTGDLVRYRPDGTIEYICRLDHQVKVRGFRIELGEIEAALSQHPAIAANVVIVREDIPGDKRLVAYLVSHNRQQPTVEELRRFLKDYLPDYMLPSVFLWLDELPLTTNAKIDYRALPVPKHLRPPDLESKLVQPQTAIQLELTHLWRAILHLEQIGIHDDFFALGGDSLQAVSLLLQIEKVFNQKLPPAILFQPFTIAQLADMLTQKRQSEKIDCLIPIQPRGSQAPLFLIPGIFGYVMCFRQLASYLRSERPLYGFEHYSLQPQFFPHLRVEDLARRYLEEIEQVQPNGPYLLAGHSFGGLVAFEMAQQLHQKGQSVEFLGLLDTFASGDLKEFSLPRKIVLHTQYFLQEGPSYISNRIIGRWRSGRKPEVTQLSDSNSPSVDSIDPFQSPMVEVLKQASKAYQPQVYPGPITFFHPIDRARYQEWRNFNPRQSWAKRTTVGLEIHQVSGGHGGMLTDPHVKNLAKTLQSCLNRAH